MRDLRRAQTPRATHPSASERLTVPREDLSLVTFHRGLETRATACHHAPIWKVLPWHPQPPLRSRI